jgi:hypothetical protein
MAIATIVVVLLLLFNRMMNVISMMDNFDANVISPQEVTMLFESMYAVAPVVVMNLTADKQKSIIFLSMAVTILPARNCKGLFYGGSSGMDDGLFGTACPQPHSIGRPFQH